jgi:predicted ATPase/DNA-binding SARP family transcriptional activator
MDELQLNMLGGLQIALGGAPLTDFISTKVPALLSYLTVTAQPHSRLELATLLWGNATEANARKSLSMALSNLRRLAAPYLEITRQTIAFNREPPYWLDVAHFCQRAIDALDHQDSAPAEELIASLTTAAELYSGDFLGGFFVRDAPTFEEWALGQREWLRQLALQVFHTLGTLYADQGGHGAAIESTARLLAIEPWQEESHRQLMQLLALSGQRSAALTQYETCCRILADELGIEPEKETTALYEAIKSGLVTLPKSKPTKLHNLPPQTTPLIGRGEELTQFVNRLQDPNYRLVSLVGEGGVGKTRLAVAAAEQMLDRFPHGVWYVPITDQVDPKMLEARAKIPEGILAQSVAGSLGFTFSSKDEPVAQLVEHLRHKEMLLILDGFEVLLEEGVGFVQELLCQTSNITLLITSRERLNLQAEYAMRIGGLPLPDIDDGPSSATFSSVLLFVERADRTPRGFELDSTNLAEVVQVCRLVDGLPLGIELAAAWAGSLSPAEIANRIQQNLDFLTTSMRDIPARHSSMRKMFESSWRLLSDSEQETLAQLSIFLGEFDEEAAQAVTLSTDPQLAGLAEKCLLRRSSGERFGMHHLLRMFAAEKLEEMAAAGRIDAEAVHHRHSLLYLEDLNNTQ